MLLAVNYKIVATEMRQKFRIDFISAAALTRHPPLSGDAGTKICSVASGVLCCTDLEERL